MKSVRQFHNTLAIDGSLFIIGGMDNSTSKYLDHCEIFDYQKNSSDRSFSNLNVARANFGVCHSVDQRYSIVECNSKENLRRRRSQQRGAAELDWSVLNSK